MPGPDKSGNSLIFSSGGTSAAVLAYDFQYDSADRSNFFSARLVENARRRTTLTVTESKEGGPVMSRTSSERLDLREAAGIFWRDVKYAVPLACRS